HFLRQISTATDGYVPAPGLDITFRRSFPLSIYGRYEQGILGYGWSHNWDYLLTDDGEGTVKIHGPGGSIRIFQEDIRPGYGYFSMEGDHGTLTDRGGGSFLLQEASGLVRVFNSDGLLEYVEDTHGNKITCSYSGSQLDALTHSGGQRLQLAYYPSGLLESVTDPDNRVTTFTYDATDDHLKSAAYFNGQVVEYDYSLGAGLTREHALTEAGLACCSHQYFTYDERGRLETMSRGGGAELLTFSYDSMGKISVMDALGHTSHFYLDHHGLLVRVTNALGHSTRLAYDQDFNLTRVTDPAGLSYIYEYDGHGNLTGSTDPLGHSTFFAYEGPYDRMTRLTDANGSATDYAYDLVTTELDSITYVDGSIEEWQHDQFGNPTSWTNRRLTPINYEWDSNGQITAKVYEDASRVDYEYDSRGNLIYSICHGDTTAMAYDGIDQLERITYPGDRFLEYTYDDEGRRESSTNQRDHRLDYHYDTVGRLEYITDESAAEIVRYHYDAVGRLARKDLGNGVYSTYQYDAASQLTHLFNMTPDDSTLSKFIYTYDSRGRRTRMETIEGAWLYEYDDLGQLAAWTAPDERRVEYEYDPLGNRITETDDGDTTAYVTNSLNQYESAGDRTYLYDADGNLEHETTPAGTTTYDYDDENRLITVTSPEGSWSYMYDGFGNRVRVSDNGVETDYVIDPIGFGDVVGEYDHATRTVNAHYDHGFGLLNRVEGTVAASFYAFDAIGSTSELTDSAGTALNSYTYEPFGAVRSQTGSIANPFEFVGEYGVLQEDNGLTHMRARHYAPNVGRFTADDPIGIEGGLNLLAYNSNDPVSFIDPQGLKGWSLWKKLRTPLYWVKHGNWLGKYNSGGNTETSVGELGDLSVEAVSLADEASRLHDRLYHEGFKNAHDIAKLWLRREVKIREASGEREKLWQRLWRWGFLHIPLPEPPDAAGTTESSGISYATDPNEKTAPSGFGPERLVDGDDLISYKVEFENDSLATAPAQIVTITDPLDPNLNWSTFELTEVSFGDTRLTIPENSQHFETTIPWTHNDVDFEVQIEIGIHHASGLVYANFYSIDPETFLPPTVDVGFLPPEDGTGRGQGHFSFVIEANEDVQAGTRIPNIAEITFDFNETIATNQIDPHDPSQGTDPEREAFVTIAPDSVSLTVMSEGGGVTSPGIGTFMYAWSDQVELIATPPTKGYRFVRWEGDVESVERHRARETSIQMMRDYTVTALFRLDKDRNAQQGPRRGEGGGR
ncbi:RHS repeat-associated core domain-containing protein, partial [Candidatus Eisenbacteria bacterium]